MDKNVDKTRENTPDLVETDQQKLYTERVNKNGPEGATNTSQGLTTSNELAEDGLDMIVSQVPEWIANKDIAITFLEFAHQDYQNSRDMRIFYAEAARSLGVTLREIANIYDMTAEGVRIMLKRAGER